MNSPPDLLEQLVDAHLEGRSVEVPVELRLEFGEAIAAHAALREMLEATIPCSADSSPEGTPPNVSAQYEIERELGRGGMGVVYLVRQRSLNRQVALKVLRPGEHLFGAQVRRFLGEAQHLARLRHPHIVSIHDVGEVEGEPYFTMDYIDGASLSSLLAKGPLTPSRAVEIFKQVAEAIQHAHRQGIIHRDLKPGNVLIDQTGHVFVTDFGLARNLDADSSMTRSGELLGTPQYMAPEQARGQSSLVGEATDIHALGHLLYEMLTGKAAYRATSPAEVLVKLLNEEAVAPRSIDRRIPRDLETICLKALQKSPAARYANASAMLEDLRRYEAGEPLLARRTSVTARAVRWFSRRWKMISVVALAALCAGLVTARFFDKSAEELIAWGDEEMKEGHPELAARVFHRAWKRLNPAEQKMLAPKLSEAIRDVSEPELALELARKVMAVAPESSFGRHNYLIAQSIALEARSKAPNGTFHSAHSLPLTSEDVQGRTFAARRLALFLDGPWGTAGEREDAESTLQAIDRSLRKEAPLANWSDDELVKLPDEPLEELQKRSIDESANPWDRGKAAIALGRKLEAQEDPEGALEAYRDALQQMRRVYPFVAGSPSTSQVHSGRTSLRGAESSECRLMRNLIASLRRIDPETRLATEGSVRLRLDHPELLEGIRLSLRISVRDPAIKNPIQGLPRELTAAVSLYPDNFAEVHLLSGTYRIDLAGTSSMWDSSSPIDPTMLDLSARHWPKTIAVDEGAVDLPPISVRVLGDLNLLSPAAEASVDLTRDLMSWVPVAGAVTYSVGAGVFKENPEPSVTWFSLTSTSVPQLRIADLPADQRATIAAHWPAGAHAGLQVQALDADGRRLAQTRRERRFLILRSLPAP